MPACLLYVYCGLGKPASVFLLKLILAQFCAQSIIVLYENNNESALQTKHIVVISCFEGWSHP